MKKLVKVVLLIYLSTQIIYCQDYGNIMTSKISPEGSIIWQKYAGSCGINAICSDKYSNVYLTGEAFAYIIFDSITLGQDLFIAKYDSVGNLKWTKGIGSFSHRMPTNSIYADSHENVYIFSVRDMYIEKYDKEGNLVWTNNLGIKFGREFGNMSINEQTNRIYLVASIDSLFPSNNNSKIVVLKNDLSNGNVIKSIKIGKYSGRGFAYSNLGCGITNKNNEIFISGSYKNADGYSDIYVAKLDTNLNILWEKQFGNNGENIAYDVTSDDENNVYITGIFSKDLYFDNFFVTLEDWSDLFVAKLSNNGVVQWVKSAGTNIPGGVGKDYGYSISYDNKENIYLSGHIGKNAYFDTISATTDECSFLTKLDKVGNIIYVKYFYNNYDIIYGSRKRCTGYVATNVVGNVSFVTNFIKTVTTNINTSNISSVKNLEFQIYPNPTKNNITVEISPSIKESVMIIYNINGQELSREILRSDKTNISLNYLSRGIYFAKFLNNNTIQTMKIVKE